MATKQFIFFRALSIWIPLTLMIANPVAPGGFGTDTLSNTTAESQYRFLFQTDEIQFEEEVVYSEPADVMFGNILTSTVDRSGQVFMGDNDQKKVHVLSPDGHYLQSFGSQGNGPGEFQMISKIAVNDDYVHVFDMIMGRINIFDANNFDFIRTVALSKNGSMMVRGAADNTGLGRPFDFHLLTDGTFLVSYRTIGSTSQRQTAIVSMEGEILEKNRFEFGTGPDEMIDNSSGNRRVMINLPSGRSTGIALSAGGVLFVNWSEHLEFDLYDEDGSHLHTFSHPHRNAPMDRRELLKIVEERRAQGGGTVMGAGGGSGGGFPAMEQMLQNIELPDTWPAVQSMYADQQNRLWVSTFTTNADERKWFLFDETGDFLGTYIWPASKSVVSARGHNVYVLDQPADDFDTVIRYRFTWNDDLH